MGRRAPGSITRAQRRVMREKLELIGDVAVLLGHPEPTVRRWIVSGCRGVYLDGLHKPGVGWVSSHPAALRFVRELWERDDVGGI